jgi:hypothetical protein
MQAGQAKAGRIFSSGRKTQQTAMLIDDRREGSKPLKKPRANVTPDWTHLHPNDNTPSLSK